MSKHTPGPWSSDQEYDETWNSRSLISVGVKDTLIAEVTQTDGNMSNEELEANARLIAAAPDLLEALCTARDHIDMGALEISHCKDAKRIRAAIAKATGETK